MARFSLVSLLIVVTCYTAAILETMAIVEFEQAADVLDWEKYLTKFNKTYDTEEEMLERYMIWKESVETVTRHNLEAEKGQHSYKMGINQFSDMTDDEFNSIMSGMDTYEEIPPSNADPITDDLDDDLPPNVDWRKKGYVTPVKYQGSCGSCYAFSATGALEGQHAKMTGKLVSLSEQNILDCTNNYKYHNHGCRGGLMNNAFQYVIDNKGIDTEHSYPYRAWTHWRCYFTSRSVGTSASDYYNVKPKGCEKALKRAVAKVGPVSIGVDARHGLKHYLSGVFSSTDCNPVKLNHGVLVVGYGKAGVDYWIVKNSWGSNWGEDGYFRLARNQGNMCGVATLASYPVIDNRFN